MSVRIGVFSGTFDPVHAGHLAFADETIKQAELDKVLFLPEAAPRRKSKVTALNKRVDMLNLAISNNPKFEVFVSKEESHSTKQTMTELHDQYGFNDGYFLIMGAEVYEHIEKWPDHRQLVDSNSFIIGLRSEDDGEIAVEVASRLHVKPRMITSTFPSLSSSKIRTAIGEGQKITGLEPEVLSYIKTNRLYE